MSGHFTPIKGKAERRKRPGLFPALVCPTGPWQTHETRDGSGRTSIDGRIMWAPYGSDDRARAVRVHELSHARWSPERGWMEATVRETGIDPATIHSMEEARVELCAIRAGLPIVKESMTSDEMRHTAERLKQVDDKGKPLFPIREVAATLIINWYRARRRPVVQAAKKRLPDIMQRVAPIIDCLENDPENLDSLRAAAILFDLLFPPPTEEPHDDDGENDPDNDNRMPPIEHHDPEARWGDMVRVDVPRPRPYRPRMRTRRTKSGLTGVAIRRVDRLLLGDGKGFRQRRRVPGGTVLIDCSGSMGSAQRVLAIIDAALRELPGATVLGYSGGANGNWEGYVGVLAENGRLFDPETFSPQHAWGGGNYVDGPALELVGTLPAPRFWVSDGHATGAGGRYATHLAAEARIICRRHGIRRIDPASLMEG